MSIIMRHHRNIRTVNRTTDNKLSLFNFNIKNQQLPESFQKLFKVRGSRFKRNSHVSKTLYEDDRKKYEEKLHQHVI